MHRVMIIGQPGSGRSTLARNLDLRTRLPVVHIDTSTGSQDGFNEVGTRRQTYATKLRSVIAGYSKVAIQ